MNDSSPLNGRAQHAGLFGLFALALCVRLAFAWPGLLDASRTQDIDTLVYRQLAESLTRGDFPSLFRTPGYPLFLVFTGGFPGYSVVPTILVQIVLDSITCLLVFGAVRRLGGNLRWAWFAGILYAFSPVAGTMSAMMLSETLSVFLTALAIRLAFREPTPGNVVLEAGCWFLATMTRPFNLLVPIWLSPWRIWLDKEHPGEWRRRGVVLAAYGLAMIGWVGCNQVRSGMPVVCSNPQVSYYIYEIPALELVERLGWSGYLRLALLHPAEFDAALIAGQQRFASQLFAGVVDPPADLWGTMDSPEWIRRISKEAAQRSAGKTSTLVGIHACGVAQALRPKWTSASWVVRLLEVARLGLCFLGVVQLARRREWWLLSLAVVWLGYSTVLAGPAAYWRFRAFAEPIIAIVAGYAISFVLPPSGGSDPTRQPSKRGAIE